MASPPRDDGLGGTYVLEPNVGKEPVAEFAWMHAVERDCFCAEVGGVTIEFDIGRHEHGLKFLRELSDDRDLGVEIFPPADLLCVDGNEERLDEYDRARDSAIQRLKQGAVIVAKVLRCCGIVTVVSPPSVIDSREN